MAIGPMPNAAGAAAKRIQERLPRQPGCTPLRFVRRQARTWPVTDQRRTPGRRAAMRSRDGISSAFVSSLLGLVVAHSCGRGRASLYGADAFYRIPRAFMKTLTFGFSFYLCFGSLSRLRPGGVEKSSWSCAGQVAAKRPLPPLALPMEAEAAQMPDMRYGM